MTKSRENFILRIFMDIDINKITRKRAYLYTVNKLDQHAHRAVVKESTLKYNTILFINALQKI